MGFFDWIYRRKKGIAIIALTCTTMFITSACNINKKLEASKAKSPIVLAAQSSLTDMIAVISNAERAAQSGNLREMIIAHENLVEKGKNFEDILTADKIDELAKSGVISSTEQQQLQHMRAWYSQTSVELEHGIEMARNNH